MPENRNQEYLLWASGDSPVEPRRSIPRSAGRILQARRAGPGCAEWVENSEQLGEILFSSSWLPNEWRRRTRKITNTERQRGLRRVNCRLGVVTGRKRGGEIAFRTHDLGIRAQPLLVGFEHCVERALRCGHSLFGCVFFFERGSVIRVRLPHFSRSRVARSSKFVLRLM